MSSALRKLKAEILAAGSDHWINDEEFQRIRDCLPADGTITAEDLEVLVEIRREAGAVCEAFDQLFFPALKAHLLKDGRISQSERFLLLRLLYSGGGADDAERQFIQELRDELREISPEFAQLYRDAMRDEDD